jgi:hypothetical protein
MRCARSAPDPRSTRATASTHRTVLEEFYQVTFRKKIYESLEELQSDLDQWLRRYNEERTHQGKMCCGRTPLQTFLDGLNDWRDKHHGHEAA